MLTNWTGADEINPTSFSDPDNWDMGLPFAPMPLIATQDADFNADRFLANSTVNLTGPAATLDFTLEKGSIDFRINNRNFSSSDLEIGTVDIASLLASNLGTAVDKTWTTASITVGQVAAGTLDLRDFTIDSEGNDVQVGVEAAGTLKLDQATLDTRGAEAVGELEISRGSADFVRSTVFTGETRIGRGVMSGATLRSTSGATNEAHWDTLGKFRVGFAEAATLTIEAAASVDAILTSHQKVTVDTPLFVAEGNVTQVDVKNAGALWHIMSDFEVQTFGDKEAIVNITDGGVIGVDGATIIAGIATATVNVTDAALDVKALTIGKNPNSLGKIVVTDGSLFSENTLLGEAEPFPGEANGQVELAGSFWMVDGDLTVSQGGSGSVKLDRTDASGESLLDVRGTFTIGTTGDVEVDGSSRADVIGILTIQADGDEKGELAVNAGSEVTLIAGGTNNGTLRVATDGMLDVRDQKLFNMGEVIAGESPGQFSLDGDFEQTSAGTMFVELGGTTSVDDYDVYAIDDFDGDGNGGAVTLSGTLDVSLINNFTAENASSYEFTVLTATESLSGSFSDIDDNDQLPEGWTWEVLYDREGVEEDEDGMDVVLRIKKPDIEATALSGDSYGGLVVDYEIDSDDTGYEADPFSIGIYTSDDGVNPTGSALQTVYVSNSADLTVGSHSAAISPTFYAQWGEHRLIAVVDSADVIDESDETNNVAELENSAFLAYGGTLSIYGDDLANAIEITESGSDYLVDIDSETILTIEVARG